VAKRLKGRSSAKKRARKPNGKKPVRKARARGAPLEQAALVGEIPWSFGHDRVSAVAVDPERLHVYWEVTEAGRERARAMLGTGASPAALALRVYDTTGRLFDGTNAHSFFDHRVENGARQKFFDIEKPGSEAFVEIGLMSSEGRFVRIVRSGKVVFPRRSPAPQREPRWLTVRSPTEPPLVEAGGAHRESVSMEKMYVPVSEKLLQGASERRLGGASGRR
jgi:hypothetical protein